MLDDSIITRYMPFERAIEFITKGEMYLARFDSFEDKLEGYAPYQLAKKLGIEWEKDDSKSYLKPSDRKKLLFASCWYNGEENLAMWDRYKSERGIAVQVRKMYMKDEYEHSRNDQFIATYERYDDLDPPALAKSYANEMQYLDDDEPDMSIKPPMGLLKHAAFKHEKEYRFVLRQNGMSNRIKASSYKFKIKNFSGLSATVITNPYMDSAITDMLTSYIDKIGISKKVNVERSKYRYLFEPT